MKLFHIIITFIIAMFGTRFASLKDGEFPGEGPKGAPWKMLFIRQILNSQSDS